MKNDQKQVRFSLIVPCFNEESNIGPLLDNIFSAMEHFPDFELIFVDDRSTDDTWKEIKKASSEDSRVKGIRLSRNFGHQAALLAGLTQSTGKGAIISLDADLQHPPEIIPMLIKKWEKGAQVVNTIRKDNNSTSFAKRISSKAFYKIFSFLAGSKLEPGQADFRLMDRVVVDAILALKERKPFFRGLISWMGFKQEVIHFNAPPRFSGKTKYTLRKMILLAVDGSISFSYIPIRFSILMGFCMTCFALSYGLYAIIVKLFFSHLQGFIPGWASIIALISLFFGVLYIQVGLIGEYIARIYIEGKTQPIYVISEKS